MDVRFILRTSRNDTNRFWKGEFLSFPTGHGIMAYCHETDVCPLKVDSPIIPPWIENGGAWPPRQSSRFFLACRLPNFAHVGSICNPKAVCRPLLP